MASSRKAEAVIEPAAARDEEKDWLLLRLLKSIRPLGSLLFDKAYPLRKRAWLYLVLPLLYALSPVDIIPEVVFGPFGLVDDLGVLMFFAKLLLGEVEKYQKTKTEKKARRG